MKFAALSYWSIVIFSSYTMAFFVEIYILLKLQTEQINHFKSLSKVLLFYQTLINCTSTGSQVHRWNWGDR